MSGTHRLAVKIEETVLGNGNWDKVTVKIPNSSYILNEVKFENNKLSVLFVYTDGTTYEPANFAFMLSAFGIDPNAVGEDDAFLVVGIDDAADRSAKSGAMDVFPAWLGSNGYQGSYVLAAQEEEQVLRNFRCPIHCPSF